MKEILQKPATGVAQRTRGGLVKKSSSAKIVDLKIMRTKMMLSILEKEPWVSP